MIDEVQMLNSKEIMEEFRGLLNMESPDGKLLNFIFYGLPELEDVLSLDEPLKQRVAIKNKIKGIFRRRCKGLHKAQIKSCRMH